MNLYTALPNIRTEQSAFFAWIKNVRKGGGLNFKSNVSTQVYSSIQLALSIISCFCKQTDWLYLKLKQNWRKDMIFLFSASKHLYEFYRPSDQHANNKMDLPQVYSGLQLAISIISCFWKQTNRPYLELKPNQRRSSWKHFFFFSKHFSQHSHPNKVKIWHRLPQQMPIRCYLIDDQSRTNKSNRK